MAPPNTLFIPEVANAHAEAAYLEIMEFLDREMGLIDFLPVAARGGDYVQNPRFGQLSAGFERADVAGTLTTSATSTTTTNSNERMVVLHRTLYHPYSDSTSRRSGLMPEAYSREIGRQMAVKAAQQMLSDIYGAAHASAQPAALDHEHDVYVDTGVAANQVDLTPTVIEAAKFKMTDHMENLDVGVCHSKQWEDVRQDLITNDDFRVPNIVGDLIRGQLYRTVLGITFIVDDQIGTEAGPTGGSPTKFRALLLRSRNRNPLGVAPVMVSLQTPLTIWGQFTLGNQTRQNQLQAYMAYALGFRGSQWDSTNGGANPSNAALTTSTNWDESNDDDEQHGIVRVVTN